MSAPNTNMISLEEAERLASGRVAEYRMNEMDGKISLNDSKTTTSLVEIKSQIAQVITMIKEQNTKQEAAQKEFKKEIESEFASKFDLERLENKLDKLWLRITVTVGTIVASGLLIGWLLTTANSFKAALAG